MYILAICCREVTIKNARVFVRNAGETIALTEPSLNTVNWKNNRQSNRNFERNFVFYRTSSMYVESLTWNEPCKLSLCHAVVKTAERQRNIAPKDGTVASENKLCKLRITRGNEESLFLTRWTIKLNNCLRAFFRNATKKELIARRLQTYANIFNSIHFGNLLKF